MARKESWRGAIIVVFKEDVPQKRIRELVIRQGCRLQDGFDGSGRTNVVVVRPGEDEAMVKSFARLPEVEVASLNDDSIER